MKNYGLSFYIFFAAFACKCNFRLSNRYQLSLLRPVCGVILRSVILNRCDCGIASSTALCNGMCGTGLVSKKHAGI